MCNRFPRFFLTIVVVQNIPLRMTRSSMATGCDVIKRQVIEVNTCSCATGRYAISTLVGPFQRTGCHQTSCDPEGMPLEGWEACMRNRK